MGRAPRTNIKSYGLNVPAELTRDNIQAWALNLAQILRFRRANRITTSGTTTGTILSFATEQNTVYGMKAFVLGRRVSGSGSLNDGYAAVIRATFRDVNGTLSEIDEDVQWRERDNANFEATFAVSNNLINLNVTGDTGHEMAWFALVHTLLASH